MFFEIPAEQISVAIELVAEQSLWEAEVGEPPVDAFALARRRGAVVAEDTPGGPRARRVVFGDAAATREEVILLAPEDRRERRHWAVAHEVGESLAWRVFQGLGVEPADAAANAREWVANRLACALLLPRGWFVDAMVEADADLFALKERFATASHELIARRWLETIGGPILVTVLDHGEVSWRRTNFTRGRPAMTSEERETWRAAHDRNLATEHEPACYGDSGTLARVRCWPVHEPGWRREVLLAEVSDDW